MVTIDTERKPDSEYSLGRIHELAAQGQVALSRRAQVDSENLGCTPEDVHECLQLLEEADFQHSERYVDYPIWHDVYHLEVELNDIGVVELYIKLTLDRNCIVVTAKSFHQHR